MTFSSPLLFTQLDPSKANSRSHVSEPDCSSQPGSAPAHPTLPEAAWLGTLRHRSETRVQGLRGGTGATQADSSDMVTSPSLQHNLDAAQPEGTGQERQSKISRGKNTPAFIKRKVTGYLARLRSHIFKRKLPGISGNHEDF